MSPLAELLSVSCEHRFGVLPPCGKVLVIVNFPSVMSNS